MEQNISVKIHWVPTEQGGKDRFPLKEFLSVAHFIEDDCGIDWSVSLKVESNQDKYVSIGVLKFFFPERVSEKLLYVGSQFVLIESKIVANGEIINMY